MNSSSKRYRNIPLVLALVIGVITLLMAFWGFLIAGAYQFDISYDGFIGFSVLLFDSVRLLFMDSGYPAPENIPFAIARFFAVLFITLGLLGVLKEINKTVWYSRRMVWFRFIGRIHKPAVVIGLGRIGLPLIKDIRNQKKWGLFRKPIFAVSNQDLPENLDYAFGDGAVVIEGDATEDTVINKKFIKEATEIFIATGDDSRNLEIAAKVKRIMQKKKNEGKTLSCVCYVHISDPGLISSVKNHKLFEEHKLDINFEFFSTPVIAARQFFKDLILDQGIGLLSDAEKKEEESSKSSTEEAQKFSLPKDKHKEAFHLFIFGFGEIGKALALATARYAHFESSLRPRLTIFVDQKDSDYEWKAFLDRYTNFSPPDLDLTSADIQDRWCATKSTLPENLVPLEVSNKEELIAKLRPHAIDYAVNSEFKPIITDVESKQVIDSIYERLKSNDPDIKAAIAFCYDDERRNFDQALRLQYELSRHLITEDPGKDCKVKCAENFSEDQLPVPIYAHLPVDTGLAELIESDLRDTGDDKTIECTNRNFPVLTFGSQEKIFSYDVIKNSGIKNYEKSLEEAYQSASQNYSQHPDFEDSTMNAVMLSEIKLDALDIYFSEKKEDLAAIFDEYYETDHIKRQLDSIPEEYRINNLDGTNIRRWIIPVKVIIESRNKIKKDNKEHVDYYSVYDRLLFLDRLVIKEEDEIKQRVEVVKMNLTNEEKNNRNIIKDIKNTLIDMIADLNKLTISNFEDKVDNLNSEFDLNDKKSAAKLIDKMSKIVTDELKNISTEATENIIASFEGYLKNHEIDADIAAEIEHNRWMGERLAKNWSFGKRDDFRKKRMTFVPWEFVYPTGKILPATSDDPKNKYDPEDHRLYDRQMLPKIIMDQRERGEEDISVKEKSGRLMYAYVNNDKKKQRI